MKQLRVRFPWSALKDDEAFFVPALDAELVKQEGLRAGFSPVKEAPQAIVGIFEGQWGVLFFRAPRSRKRRGTAAPAPTSSP